MMDTIDPKMARLWTADRMEALMIELGSEKAISKSWAQHYDQLHGKYEKLCDALYKIVGLDEYERETCMWIAKDALKDVGEWPR